MTNMTLICRYGLCLLAFGLTLALEAAIPAAYVPLEYVTIPKVAKTRNAVATGIPWTDVKRIDFRYATTDTAINEFMAFAAYLNADYATAKVPYIDLRGKTSISLVTSSVTASATYDPSADYTRDGTFLSVSLTTSSTTAGYLCFGAAWSDSAWSITADWGEVTVYGADDVVLGHYLPCKRQTDSVAGFWDDVSQTFLTKAVDSWPDFVAGPEKAREPGLLVTGSPSELGVPVPGYGFDANVAVGVGKEYAAPSVCTNAAGDVAAMCAGWELTRLDGTLVDAGGTTNATIVYSADIVQGTLTWKWACTCKVTVTACVGGTANVGEYWLKNGEQVTLTAYAADGYYFDRWAGDVAEQDAAKNPLTLTCDGAAHAVQAVFKAGKPSVGEPPFLASKAVLWLDAALDSSVLAADNGVVTNWISRDTTHKVAVPRNATGFQGPVYEATAYGQKCLDFGAVGSKKDMQYSSTTFRTAFFCVKIAQDIGAWLLGDTSASVMHRGSKGEWKYSNTHNKINEAWQDGEKVMSSLLTTKMPDDDFYVFAVRMSSNQSSSLLTSGNSDGRNGGRQLSEVILCGELTDDEIATVNAYLLRKWKADPALTVAATPEQRGVVSPDYGSYDDFEKGKAYSFSASKAVTNDSQTLLSVLNGWTLTRTDFSSASGSESEMSFVYDDMLGYASLTWRWSDWLRLPVTRGAFLPGRYRCLEYVEQGGGARIETDIKLTAKTTDVLFTVGARDETFYATNSVPTDNGDQKWIGTTSGSEFSFGRIKNAWYLGCMGSLYDGVSFYKQSLGPLTVVISHGKWFFLPPDSETEYQSGNYGDFSSLKSDGQNLWLFHCGGLEGTHRWAPPGTRIYQVEIYEGTTCAHKLVACARRKDNQLGFYDVITGKFYTNATGTLLAGPTNARYEKGLLLLVR